MGQSRARQQHNPVHDHDLQQVRARRVAVGILADTLAGIPPFRPTREPKPGPCGEGRKDYEYQLRLWQPNVILEILIH